MLDVSNVSVGSVPLGGMDEDDPDLALGQDPLIKRIKHISRFSFNNMLDVLVFQTVEGDVEGDGLNSFFAKIHTVGGF